MARYRILNELGEGGMGIVYRALQVDLGREVAMKVLLEGATASDRHRIRFEREVAACIALRHPHVIQIYDSGSHEGNPFYTMELLEGQAVQDRIESNGPQSAVSILKLLVQIGDALAYCHSQGVVHRDIKPHNIVLRTNGDAVLMDFGLLKQDAQETLTQEGALVGTPRFLAPEVIRGDPPSAASDLYALGLTAYEMALGDAAYQGATQLKDLLVMILKRPLPLIHEVRPEVPEPLGRLIHEMLEPRPERRVGARPAWKRAREILEVLDPDSARTLRESAAHFVPSTDEIPGLTDPEGEGDGEPIPVRTRVPARITSSMSVPVPGRDRSLLGGWGLRIGVAGGLLVILLVLGIDPDRGRSRAPVSAAGGSIVAGESSTATGESVAAAGRSTPAPVPSRPYPHVWDEVRAFLASIPATAGSAAGPPLPEEDLADRARSLAVADPARAVRRALTIARASRQRPLAERYLAVRVLVLVNRENAPLALSYLTREDPDDRVRLLALWALARHPSPQVRFRVHEIALEIAFTHGDPKSLDLHPRTRHGLALSLMAIGMSEDIASLEPLSSYLTWRSRPGVQVAAAAALGFLRLPECREALQDLMSRDEGPARDASVWALGHLGERARRALPILRSHALQQRPAGGQLAMALHRIGGADMVEDLVKILEWSSTTPAAIDEREAAAYALGMGGSPRARAILRGMVAAEEAATVLPDRVIAAAVDGLGFCGTPQDSGLLEALVEDPGRSKWVRARAVTARIRLGGPDLESWIGTILEGGSWPDQVRQAARRGAEARRARPHSGWTAPIAVPGFLASWVDHLGAGGSAGPRLVSGGWWDRDRTTVPRYPEARDLAGAVPRLADLDLEAARPPATLLGVEPRRSGWVFVQEARP